eukprot:1369887-Pyramimonas_sp.AAC.1
MEPLPLPAMPAGITQDWCNHDNELATAFMESELCYPRPMRTAEEIQAGGKWGDGTSPGGHSNTAVGNDAFAGIG